MEETREEMREVECFTCIRDSEVLCGSVQEAVEEWVDQRLEDIDGPLPETVTVYHFARMVPDAERLQEWILESLLENLDEEYGNWQGEPAKPTDAMKQAAQAFVAAVLAEYEVWACEEVGSEVVRVADYYTEVGS